MEKCPTETPSAAVKKLTNELALREHLAAARTVLANERTFLSFQRTAVTELAAAVTLIKLFDDPLLTLTGWALLPVAGLTGYYGIRRYMQMRRLIRRMEKMIENEPPLDDFAD